MHLKLTLSLAAGLSAAVAFAQPRTSVTINAATVFLQGAELSSSARIGLPAGESDVLFTNIAGSVNQQSLNIGAEHGVVVQSATFQRNYLGDSSLSPRARLLRDSISLLETLDAPIQDHKAVLEEQLEILKENRKVAGANTSLSVAELQKLLDLTAAKTASLLAQGRELERQSQKLQSRLSLLRAQQQEEQQKSFQPGGALLVKFYAPAATSTQVNITYVVPNAGWTPSYDLRVERISDPVKLFYKASVYQNSGVKWNNVKLSLSTGNPNESAEAPTLSPQYLSFYTPPADISRLNNIALNRPRNAYTYKFEQDSYRNELQRNASRNSADFLGVAGGLNSEGINRYTRVDASGIATSFDVELPYSIPSDGQQHNVAIKTFELPATYRYFAVPRLDKDAFLQAQITNWEDLNLLPAQTNVFFEGSYVGQGNIDMRNVRDTMNLSLGRDKKIIIRRERDKSFRSEKVIGTNVRQEYAWTISVRNTRKEPIQLVVLDQVPVSNDKEIVVEEQTAKDATVDEATGRVEWTLQVKPAELRKLETSYIVKYPKGRTIGGL